MSRLRSWVACLALISFLAGGLAGVLYERQRAGDGRAPERPFGAYQELFTRQFDLPPERERLFSEVVRHYHGELEDVRQRALEESMGTLEPELTRLGLRYRDLIRNHVLSEADRAEFDRLALASPWPPTPDRTLTAP